MTVALGVLAVTVDAVAQDGDQPRPDQGDARHLFAGSADDVLSRLSDLRFDRKSVTTFDPFTGVRAELKKLNKTLQTAANLRIGFAWTSLYQNASASMGPNDAATSDFDFFGRWMPLRTRSTLGYVIFEAQARNNFFTDITPNDLGGAIGSLWGTVNGFNSQTFHVKQIYWQQFLFRNTFTYRIGKVDQSNVFNINRLQSDNLYFLNAAFSDNPTMPYPNNGFGTDLTWRPDPLWYVSYGISNADSDSVDRTFDKFLTDVSWFTVAEVGLTPWFDGVGAGQYRLTAWYSDARSASEHDNSRGFALSFDQSFGPKWIGFLRYGLGDGNLTTTKQIVAGGFGIRRPFGENDDFAGVGFSWGSPTDTSLRDQMVAEGFYRLQWSPAIQITADAQLIINPSSAPDQDMVTVFGVRLRITF